MECVAPTRPDTEPSGRPTSFAVALRDEHHRRTYVATRRSPCRIGSRGETRYRFDGSERGYATPRMTQRSSWRFVRTPWASTRTRPSIARPPITKGCAWGLARNSSLCSGSTRTIRDPVAAGRDRHLADNQDHETPEHALLADIRLAGDQLTNALGEILVVRHAQHHRLPVGDALARALPRRASSKRIGGRPGHARNPRAERKRPAGRGGAWSSSEAGVSRTERRRSRLRAERQ
jgi:hypothetical protein